MKRRKLLQMLAAGSAFYGPWKVHHAWAQAPQKKPLVIGLTMDASGQFGASGTGTARRHDGDPRVQREGRRARAPHRGAAHRHRDHARDRLARRGAHDHAQRGRVPDRRPELGVANAIGQVAQKYGVVYLNSNSSSPTESGRDCKRVKFVWDGNGTNFAQAIVKNAIKVNGGNWALLTNDYIWGHNTSKATRELVVKNGGRVVDELMVPQGTRDFSSFLLKLQQMKPQVGRPPSAATTSAPCASRCCRPSSTGSSPG